MKYIEIFYFISDMKKGKTCKFIVVFIVVYVALTKLWTVSEPNEVIY